MTLNDKRRKEFYYFQFEKAVYTIWCLIFSFAVVSYIINVITGGVYAENYAPAKEKWTFETAVAALSGEYKGTEAARCDSLAPTVLKLEYYCSGGFMKDSFANVTKLLTINVTDSWYSKMLRPVMDGCVGAGCGLTAFWGLMDFVDKIQMQNASLEQFLKIMMKITAGVVIVGNVDTVVNWFVMLGNAAAKLLSTISWASVGTVNWYDKYTEYKSLNMGNCLGRLMSYLVPGLGIIISYLVMMAMMYGRLIEIGIRTAFAPLGIADAFSQGIHSAGMRYMKKYFAVCLQGAILVGIVLVGSQLSVSIAKDEVISFGGNGIAQLIVMVSMVGLMLKSQGIVNDIAGA